VSATHPLAPVVVCRLRSPAPVCPVQQKQGGDFHLSEPDLSTKHHESLPSVDVLMPKRSSSTSVGSTSAAAPRGLGAWRRDAAERVSLYAFGSDAGPDAVGCTWDLQYRLSGVPSGTWTQSSRGDRVEAVAP